MKNDLLAKCSRNDLEALRFGYWSIMRVFEDICGGPGKAVENREYLIARQNYRKVNELLLELSE